MTETRPPGKNDVETTVMVRGRIGLSRLASPIANGELERLIAENPVGQRIRWPHTIVSITDAEILRPRGARPRPEERYVEERFRRLRDGSRAFVKHTRGTEPQRLMLVGPGAEKPEPETMTRELPQGTDVVLVLQVFKSRKGAVTGTSLRHVIARKKAVAA